MSVTRKSKKSVGAETRIEEAPERPAVIVEFLFDHGLLLISVRNIGAGPAIKISVEFDKKIIGLGGTKDISALALFRNIEFLGPAREIVTLLDTSASYFQRKQPTKLSARISYLDDEGRKFETTIKHDLEIYRDLSYLLSLTTSDNKSSSCF